MLGICQNVLNIVLGRPEVVVPYNITIEPIHEYDQAFAIFDSHLEKYDIVMLDDLWLRPFESRLRTLSSLDSFQDHFKKNLSRKSFSNRSPPSALMTMACSQFPCRVTCSF